MIRLGGIVAVLALEVGQGLGQLVDLGLRPPRSAAVRTAAAMAGSSRAIRMAMITMTTSSSISVKPSRRRRAAGGRVIGPVSVEVRGRRSASGSIRGRTSHRDRVVGGRSPRPGTGTDGGRSRSGRRRIVAGVRPADSSATCVAVRLDFEAATLSPTAC